MKNNKKVIIIKEILLCGLGILVGLISLSKPMRNFMGNGDFLVAFLGCLLIFLGFPMMIKRIYLLHKLLNKK